MGQQLDEAGGQEKIRCGTWCWILESWTAASVALPVSPAGDEQVPLACGPQVGDIYSVGTDFCFRVPNLSRMNKDVDELKG